MQKEHGRIRRLHDTAKFDEHQLSNGITVWLQRPTILIDYEGYLSVFFKNVGSVNDPYGLEGLAHFLEHMLFRASKEYSSESELKKPVIENGGVVNAFTCYEQTEYFVEIAQDYFEQARSVLYALVGEAVFEQEHILLERQIILREISRSKLLGVNLIRQHVREFKFGKKDPFTHRILGFPSSIEKINAEALEYFYEKYYHAGNANIICGGSFSKIPNVLDLLEDTFGGIRGGERYNPITIVENNIKQGVCKFADKRYGMDVLNMGYYFTPMSFEQRAPLRSIFESLAGCDISPFVKEIRENRGLTYHINASVSSSRKGSFAGFDCEMEPSSFELTQNCFIESLSKLNADCVSKHTLQIQRERLGSFQKPVDACKYLVNEIISFGRPYSFHETEDIADAVEIGEVLAWRDKLLNMNPTIMEFRKK